jgi:hypothetical protein
LGEENSKLYKYKGPDSLQKGDNYKNRVGSLKYLLLRTTEPEELIFT